jgi:hypothetical protein
MSLSAYEEERERTIASNNEKLVELGLDPPPPRRAPAPAPANKRKRPEPKPEAFLPTEVRRSARHRTATGFYTEPAAPLSERRRRARPYEAPDDDDFINDGDPDDEGGSSSRARQPAAEPPVERAPAEPGSSRSIKLDVDAFVAEHVGRRIDGPCTKESVVRALNGGRHARFSKYGILEWKNAVCLWINVGGADYKNVFLGGGEQVTWYASPKMHEQSPVVHRLIHSAASGAKGDGVLLFCRQTLRVGNGPYVCCGRLGYVSHDPRRRPLKFVWELRDAAQLRSADAFQELLREA